MFLKGLFDGESNHITSNTCESISTTKAINYIVKRLYGYINLTAASSDFGFSNKLSDILMLPKEIEKLYDVIYYGIREELDSDSIEYKKFPADISVYSKRVLKNLKELKFDPEVYYVCKYDLDLLAYNKSACSSLYVLDADGYNYMTILYACNCLIEIVFFKTDKRKIIGIDYNSKSLKYLSLGSAVFDTVCMVFRSEYDCKLFDNLFNLGRDAYKQKSSAREFGWSGTVDVIDKVDDALRVHQTSLILCDLLEAKENLHFSKPSLDRVKQTLKLGLTVSINSESFHNRSHLTPQGGGLVVVPDEFPCIVKSVFIKDVILQDRPYIVLSYTFKDGEEDTLIIPLRFNTIMPTIVLEVIYLAMKYYNIDTSHYCPDVELDYEIISSHYWNFRKSSFISDKDKMVKGKLIREYKEVTIGIHKAKLGNPSPTALALAEKYQIKLNDGETIVQSHTRHYSVSQD